MADHVNITQVEWFDERWDARLAYEKLAAELSIMTARFRDAQSNLDAIFTRIARGDDVELHYRNGDVIRVAALAATNPQEHDDE